MYRSRRSESRWPIVSILSVIALGSMFIYSALNTEAISQRIEAIPYYARTYINKFRPKVEIPAPPAVSAITPKKLLQPPTLKNNLPAQSDDTPAYFNEESLTPAESAPQNTDGVALVKSTIISPESTAPEVALTGVTHQWQTWNNCGPATITMNLSYYGRTETQVESAQFLKPNKEDKNVNPNELAAYARSVGFEAVVRVGGDIELLMLTIRMMS